MRASASSRFLRPLTKLSIRPLSEPTFLLPSTYRSRPSKVLPPTFSSLSRKYSTPSDSPSILPPPSSSSSTSSSPSTPSDTSSPPSSTVSFPLAEKPSYELTFTCKKCSHRSSHKVTKQAYHKGTVLIQCPGCEVRHLIADHLKIFRDKPTTIEDIMKEQGEKIKKGIKYRDGDIEILPEEEVEEEPEVELKGDREKK
ncbi:hypothetical protein TWF569_002350 [Orbilia oligospora]|uniref:DNL-type domain-containing protein n=1 Tax=Orbilia oligospora TaxID=2813651 RepID=A0A7C8NHK0_ORBOL|nr:hypothetical protein TWF103_011863 [Orbilia oligospora]KAF3109931.1 hypothetical protein TWF102_009197 [Orbilia oligospora]KAF3133280.1 hypothetical protein TWF594_009232 [Orbilia oligospora]KAF3145643.1 hypothetical protein TWF703_006784 [Orbilia oligospora]KAF3153406.1 hypothetical protein TWF569_002350 [Orbilia oligospora]